MGFSLVASAAIIGVSILIAIEIIIGTTIPTITDMHESFDDMKDRAIDQVQTDINITTVTTAPNGSNYDINITVENSGSVTLKTSFFNILINGTEEQFTYSKSYLHPENEIYFNKYNFTGSGDRILKVVTNNGISDYYKFTLS